MPEQTTKQTCLFLFNNQNLFSNNYLDFHLPETVLWEEQKENAKDAFDAIKKAYESIKPLKVGPGEEAELENKFIQPVLSALGYAYHVQPVTQRGTKKKRPDYALFKDNESYELARKLKDSPDKFFLQCLTILEAKYWGRRLNDTDKRDILDSRDPTAQTVKYLDSVNYHTDGKINWAILTNGKHWRLFYYRASSRSGNYYEIDLEEIIAKNNIEDFLIAILRAYGELKLKNKPPIFIDEPELYMHPQSQRNFYRILRELTEDKYDENGELVREGLQIFYTTHSPAFLDAGHFSEIFIVRRNLDDKGEDEGTKIFSANPDDFALDWEARNSGKTSDKKTILSLYQNALQQTGDTQRANEAFFAKKIILVEGGTEMFGLPVFFDAIGFNLDKQGISIVSVGGKTELDRFYRLYNELGIPTYIIFDGDANNNNKKDKNAELNRALQELLGESSPKDFPDTIITSRYAVFKDKYESTLREIIPDYSAYESECSAFGGKPIKGRICAEKTVKEKQIPKFIYEIKDKIQNLKWKGACLKTKNNNLNRFER